MMSWGSKTWRFKAYITSLLANRSMTLDFKRIRLTRISTVSYNRYDAMKLARTIQLDISDTNVFGHPTEVHKLAFVISGLSGRNITPGKTSERDPEQTSAQVVGIFLVFFTTIIDDQLIPDRKETPYAATRRHFWKCRNRQNNTCYGSSAKTPSTVFGGRFPTTTLIKSWLSCRRKANFLSSVVDLSYVWLRIEGHLGNVD